MDVVMLAVLCLDLQPCFWTLRFDLECLCKLTLRS